VGGRAIRRTGRSSTIISPVCALGMDSRMTRSFASSRRRSPDGRFRPPSRKAGPPRIGRPVEAMHRLVHVAGRLCGRGRPGLNDSGRPDHFVKPAGPPSAESVRQRDEPGAWLSTAPNRSGGGRAPSPTGAGIAHPGASTRGRENLVHPGVMPRPRRRANNGRAPPRSFESRAALKSISERSSRRLLAEAGFQGRFSDPWQRAPAVEQEREAPKAHRQPRRRPRRAQGRPPGALHRRRRAGFAVARGPSRRPWRCSHLDGAGQDRFSPSPNGPKLLAEDPDPLGTGASRRNALTCSRYERGPAPR